MPVRPHRGLMMYMILVVMQISEMERMVISEKRSSCQCAQSTIDYCLVRDVYTYTHHEEILAWRDHLHTTDTKRLTSISVKIPSPTLLRLWNSTIRHCSLSLVCRIRNGSWRWEWEERPFYALVNLRCSCDILSLLWGAWGSWGVRVISHHDVNNLK